MVDITVRQLGGVVLPEGEASQSGEEGTRETDLAQSGRLAGDTTVVDRLTNSAADLTIQGLYRPPQLPPDRVEMVAQELSELGGSDRGPLSLFDTASEWRKAGFYELARATADPAHPTEPRVQEYSVALQRAGSRHDSFRAIQTTPESISNPFGTGATARVAVPESATKTMWFDAADEQTQKASAVTTEETARGTVALFEPPSAFDRPALLYDVAHETDVRSANALDTRGTNSRTDNNDLRQWQFIYETAHDQSDAIVLSSDALRIRLPEGSGTDVTAERWDAANTTWQSVGLPSISRYPMDVDLKRLSQQQVTAQVRFREAASPDYAVNISLDYGQDDAVVLPAPDESDPLPAALDSLLSPIASGVATALHPDRQLVKREVARR